MSRADVEPAHDLISFDFHSALKGKTKINVFDNAMFIAHLDATTRLKIPQWIQANSEGTTTLNIVTGAFGPLIRIWKSAKAVVFAEAPDAILYALNFALADAEHAVQVVEVFTDSRSIFAQMRHLHTVLNIKTVRRIPWDEPRTKITCGATILKGYTYVQANKTPTTFTPLNDNNAEEV